MRIGRIRDGKHTWELPRIELVEIDLGDDGHGNRLPGALPAEVVQHKFLIRRMESEPGGQLQISDAHFAPPLIRTTNLFLSLALFSSLPIFHGEVWNLGTQRLPARYIVIEGTRVAEPW